MSAHGSYTSPSSSSSSSSSSSTSSVEESVVHRYSLRSPRGVSIKTLLEHGERSLKNKEFLMKAGQWLHEELPIRFARQVRALDVLPYGLCLMPSVRNIRSRYVQSIDELHNLPRVTSWDQALKFSDTIKDIFEKHSFTFLAMAKGLQELRGELGKLHDIDVWRDIDVTQYLDSFYTRRIGIRLLISQHFSLVEQVDKPLQDYVGIICKHTNVNQVATDAANDATFICTRTHGIAPEVIFSGTSVHTFPSLPSYLYYVLFELLKNSMHATIQTHYHKKNNNHHVSHGKRNNNNISNSSNNNNDNSSSIIPPIKVIIASGDRNEDISIKISDEGGGLPRSHMPRIFSYLYTTADDTLQLLSTVAETSDFGKEAPLAGLGCGLPLSRAHARYFGGDLQLVSLEGFGTDAYVHIPRQGDREELTE
eukprot:TRINITY_DN2832_c0_g2_i1.p1 TRINITY_DN2832_c0_g2~~TRINITY_DN2832_c0_g2_i1.p1  ORF type:complete len:450 (+),score=90.61 TRINITY_DN2832_c0_g2_i1:85-1350(+)